MNHLTYHSPTKRQPQRRPAPRPRKPVNGFRRKFDFYWRLPLWKKILLIAGPTVVLLVVGGLITTIYFANTLASKERIMNRNSTGVTVLDRNGQVFYSFYDAQSQTHVPLDQISPVTQQAVIAAEDKDFYKHAGFSPLGVLNAIRQNLLPGGSGGGGSTITQQMVKNALLTQQRSFIRKYQEFVLAIEIERRYSKQEILEMYLNSAYFGEGAFGIEDAAHAYFGKQAKDLDLAQASLLVGLLPAPSAYSPITGDPVKAERRQNYVLERMQEDKYITKEQLTAAGDQVLSYVAADAAEKPVAPHFALMVREQLEAEYGEEKIARSGYKVTTTLDTSMQAKAEEAVSAQVSRLGYANVSNGAAVAIDPKSGDILALVGSADWNNESFGKLNMATAPRQPGSSFKPLVYATGIEDRTLTAATILHDKPTTYGSYAPLNYNSKSFWGDVTVRRALANSLNIPAVEAMNKIGIGEVMQTAKDMGVTTLTESPSTYGLPLALGAGEAKLTEMTNVYAAFANEGRHNELQAILKINDKYGKQIFTATPTNDEVISSETAYIVSQMLSDNDARSETFGSSLTVAANRPVAVKTGTTNDYKDAWTIGYTPTFAVGVWIGNSDNTPMTAVAGSSGAAPIWRTLMQQYMSGRPIEQFSQPRGVVAANVCRGQEAVAEKSGTNTFSEYFIEGTVFGKSCNTAPKEEPKPTPSPTPVTPPTEDDEPSDEPPADDDDPTPTPTTPTPTPTTPVTPPTPSPTPSPGGSTPPPSPSAPSILP